MISQISKKVIEDSGGQLRAPKALNSFSFLVRCLFLIAMLLAFSAIQLNAAEQPSRLDIEAYVVSQMWKGFELGPFEYEIYPEKHSGRISVAGKNYLKEDLFLIDEYHEKRLQKDLESLIPDEPGYLEKVKNVVWEKYKRSHHSTLPIFAVVNQKDAEFEFRGNLFYQKEIDGWSIAGPLQFAEPLGRMRSDYTSFDDSFILLGSKEYDAVLSTALSKRNELVEIRRRLAEDLKQVFQKDNTVVLTEKVRDSDWNPLLVFKVRDEPSIEKYRDYSRGGYSQRAEPFYVKGWGEVQSERPWGHLTVKKGEKVFVEVRGQVIGWDQWLATVDSVLVTSEVSARTGKLDVSTTWDGDKFITDLRPRGAGDSYPVRTTFQRLEAVSVQEDPPSSEAQIALATDASERDLPDAVGGHSGKDSTVGVLKDRVVPGDVSALESEDGGETNASNTELVEPETIDPIGPVGAVPDEEVLSEEAAEPAKELGKNHDIQERDDIADVDVPTELLALAERGALTVRGLRGFGLLDAEEDRAVLSLRSRGIDLLGADVRQLRLWADAGGVDERSFSENEMLQLRKVILKLDMVEKKVGSRG